MVVINFIFFFKASGLGSGPDFHFKFDGLTGAALEATGQGQV